MKVHLARRREAEGGPHRCELFALRSRLEYIAVTVQLGYPRESSAAIKSDGGQGCPFSQS